ncbi:c2 domain-containing protein [Quercus suber]|uniref:C2 domain-containing protein n=1 Tax=Quercus suber TaxID=58331 RepID=A0AAW0KE78_QUESU
MEGAILEIILVNAEGITHTNLVGTPAYYVIIECGTHVHRSKVSSGEDDKAWWNEKFTFERPLSDWKRLTHLKFKIMNTEFLSDGGFVGETIIHLGGIITEGSDRAFLEVKPAPYNVAWWNEKFTFERPLSDWKRLTHLKFKIMNTEFLSDGGFVGETIIHLGGIITEGSDRAFLEVKPAPYNVKFGTPRIKTRMDKDNDDINWRSNLLSQPTRSQKPEKWDARLFHGLIR